MRFLNKKISRKNLQLYVILITILLITLLTLPVYAEGEIFSVKYSVSGEYIMRIKAETTAEEFLNNIATVNQEELEVLDAGKEVASSEYIKTGMQLKVGNTTNYTLVVRGDINPDGKLTPTDLSQLKKHRVGLEKLEGARLKAADINYNEEITVLDISQLKMLLVGMDLGESEISTGNIIVTPSTTDASKEVTLRIAVKEGANINYDKIKVSLNNGATWENCDGEVRLTENTEVFIKLVQEYTYEYYKYTDKYDVENLTEDQLMQENETVEEYMERLLELGLVEKVVYTEEIIIEEDTYIVNNIDNVLPDEFEFSADATTSSINISAETVDMMKDYQGNLVQTVLSGVKEYEYRINDSSWQSSNEFTDLNKDTEYRVYVRAIDYAGNIREASNNGSIVKTDNIEIANASIEFEYSNKEITNEDVVVTMKCEGLENTEFKIQYQINTTDGEWQDGEKYLATGNCTIYARIADNTNQEGIGEYAEATITNIDKLAPNKFTPEIVEKTNTNIKIGVAVDDKEATDTSCKSGIESYTYYMLNDKGEEIVKTEETVTEYNFTELDLENYGYYIYVIAKDKAGNATTSEGISVGKIENNGLGIGVINPGPDNVTINNGEFRYFNPVIPVGFKAVNTEDASWEGVMPKDWNKGLVIEDKYGNQFVWIPVDGEQVKYEKGKKVWDYGDNAEWEKLTSQIIGDDLPLSLKGLDEEEIGQIEKYEGFYVSRYEAGNNNNTLASQKGLRVVNAVTYEQAKNYAESMYRLPKVKSGLLTGTMWDTMTKWIANEKGEGHVINNINSGNTFETAFTFSGMYATGPNSVTEKRSAYMEGTNIKKEAKRRILLTTGLVEQFKDKNIYDTAGNVWEYTSEYLINEESTKQYIARGGNYYWQYDKIVAAGTALREYVSELEGEARNEGGFRIALFLVEGATEVGVFEDFNRTIDGNEATYQNPVIPAGFAAVNVGANWGNGSTKKPEWNNGLVIEDKYGNQFVWVPVDGTEVKYEKWTKVGISYEEATGEDLPEILSTWGEEEKTQVEKYGGFYVARYESSISEEGKVQTQGDKEVLLNRNYEEMKTLSEDMGIKEENKKYTATGIITGTQWDTVMRWIANEIGEKQVLQDSTSWGTYGKSINRTGATSVKNIYDIAGNAWEMTAEKQGEKKRVYRGGVYLDTTTPVAYRGAKDMYYSDSATGFRITLYVTGEIKQEASMVPIQDDTPLNGTRGTPPIPAASESVKIIPSTTEWTNKNVDIEIENTNPYYITQYQINGTTGKWSRDKKFTATGNCTIYARLANTKGQGGSTIKYIVGNIDKVAPKDFTPTATNIGPFSVTIRSNASDTLSGIGNCKYYVNGVLVYDGAEVVHKISNLKEKTTYSIYVVATDKAGNSTTSSTITVTTLDKYIHKVVSPGQSVEYNGNGYTDWKVMSVSGSTVTLVSSEPVASLGLHGEDGTWNGGAYMQSVANMFINYKYATSARSVNLEDLSTLALIGASTASSTYWLPDTFANGYANRTHGHYIIYPDGRTDLYGLYHANNTYSCVANELGVRVIVTLKENIFVTGGEGTKNNPWKLDENINKVPKVGDYVQYSANGYSRWRILVNNGNNIELISDGYTEDLTLSGTSGVANGPSQINDITKKYINTTYATSARSVDLPELAVLRKNNMSAIGSAYWIPRTYSNGYKGRSYGLYAVDTTGSVTARWETQPHVGDIQGYIGKLGHAGDSYDKRTATYGVRPIVTLKSNVKIVGGSGTKSDPWKIQIN